MEGKKSSFICLKVKPGENEIDRREYLFFSIISKSKIFVPPKLGGTGDVGLRAQNYALHLGFVRGRWMIRGGTNSY